MNSNKSKISYKRGFTLIELLVVVLIIGILAAVALPQYQLMVMKSRISAHLPLLRAIAQANERFYLKHGYYTRNWDDLDVDIPKAFKQGSNKPYFVLYQDNVVMHYGTSILINYLHGTALLPGHFVCNGYGDALASKLCRSFSKNLVYPWTPYYTYW